MKKKIILYILFLIAIIQVRGNDPVVETNPVGLPVFNENYQRYVTTLASDEFEGRAPLTPGGFKTKDFIESEFRRIGLKPANNGSYRQQVPVYRTYVNNFSNLKVSGDNYQVSFTMPEDVIISTQEKADHISITNSELVFAGYGIVAPEYDWDDYNDMDLTGKTVLAFYNDPGYEYKDEDFFRGTTLSTYGRMNHKYEQAFKLGASAVYMVHEEGPFPADWERLKNFASRSRLQLDSGDDDHGLIAQGWMNKKSAEKILKLAGYTFEDLKNKALQNDFQAIPLGVHTSVSFDLERISGSYNIAGYLEGSQFPDETVIYIAHWDHLGTVETEEGTVIYNGAIDNATGTAAIMAIAERFAIMDPPPARSVLFLAVTAEESGLLGSRYYVNNPIFPLETTAGVINIDMINVSGPTRDLFMIGYGLSDFQEIVRKQLADQHRVLLPDPKPEQQYFRRSDHYNFARAGVPVIFTYGGTDFTGPNAHQARKYYDEDDKRYHTPDDMVHEHWNWEGIDNNLWIFFNTGLQLANSRLWPKWSEGSPYKEVRIQTDYLREKDRVPEQPILILPGD
jgi:hypothetical protein